MFLEKNQPGNQFDAFSQLQEVHLRTKEGLFGMVLVKLLAFAKETFSSKW
jgi:hypothetical protein